MRHLLTRYSIERLTPSGATQYYDGCEVPGYDGFSSDPEYVEEFLTREKAQRRADRVGGIVFKSQRWSRIPDFVFTIPVVRGADLQAAE